MLDEQLKIFLETTHLAIGCGTINVAKASPALQHIHQAHVNSHT